MKRKKRNTCLYQRNDRWWGDFRGYQDVGGKKEPLVPGSESFATRDHKVAQLLYSKRVKHYETLRRNRAIVGIVEDAALAKYSEYHLDKLRCRAEADPTVRPGLSTIDRYAGALANVIDHFGPGTALAEITTLRLADYVERREKAGAAPATIHQETVALSGLFKRAVFEQKALNNPVPQLIDRPSINRPEATWLEIAEAAALLEAAAELDANPTTVSPWKLTFLESLTATPLLSGMRKSEEFGLERADIDFNENVIRIRDNKWRKTCPIKRRAERAVPLWPQLREILGEYLEKTPPHISGLLFPSPKDGGPMRDFRGSLVKACEIAGIKKHVTPHTLRHTYTAVRLRTYHTGPNGEPIRISLFDVARELGHRSTAMIERVYGHVLQSSALLPEVRYESKKGRATEAGR